jgi:hypothetical protein
MNPHQQHLIEQGLARVYRGRVIPVMRGGSDADDNLFPDVPTDLSALSADELSALEASIVAGVQAARDNAAEFVTDEYTPADLLAEAKAAVESLGAIRTELASRVTAEAEDTTEVETDETADTEGAEGADVDAELAALAAEAAMKDTEDDEDTEGETDGIPAGEKVMPNVRGKAKAKGKTQAETVTAAAQVRVPLPRPVGGNVPREHRSAKVTLTAGAAVSNIKPLGEAFDSMTEVAKVMQDRLRSYGHIPEGMRENDVVARADWRHTYPEDRHLTGESLTDDMALVASVTDPKRIKTQFEKLKRAQIENPYDQSLVAAGGLCNPVTPYYNLQMLSTPMRPVQAALPSFNADRGGIIFVQPAGLSAFSSAVGLITEAQDAAGGSSAQKSCLTVVCPPVVQTDVDIIYHCLQFGNLGARSFPEQVAQASETTLAAHARLAEANLLTQIDTNSTQVTAGSLGLGASATIFSQVLAAANGVRSANRMDPTAILRLMLPFWAVDLIVSDVIRSQFERFDTTEAKVTALFRSFNIEPTYYIDSAAGRGQVFATQGAGVLNTFPSNVVMYLFPEGSHLFLDGGVLELGIVRDSVLNSTNVFQLFGESFENSAFVGIQSLAIVSSTCDSGRVAAPYADHNCPYTYATAS